MSVFSSFNLNQCMKQTFLEEKMCLKLLNSIPLINYDEHTRRYSFNPMFDGFILQVLDEMPVDEVTKITLRAADTNLDDGNYFSDEALQPLKRNIGKYISIILIL